MTLKYLLTYSFSSMLLFILLGKMCRMEHLNILYCFADCISLMLCNMFLYHMYLYKLVFQSGDLFNFSFSILARIGGIVCFPVASYDQLSPCDQWVHMWESDLCTALVF